MNYGENISQIEEEIRVKKPETYKQLFDILQVAQDSSINNKNLISICQQLGFILLPSTSLKNLRDFLAKNIEQGIVSKKLYILDFLYFLDICKIFNITIKIDKNIIKDYYNEMTGDKNPESFEDWYNNHIVGSKTAAQRVNEGNGIYLIRMFVGLAMGNFS